MKRIVINILFIIVSNILFIFVFQIMYSILAEGIHYFNYKIGASPLVTLTCLDSVPLIVMIESILFLVTSKWLCKKSNNKAIAYAIRLNYYYFIILFIYSVYFLIISYLEFYGITNRLPLSLYSL